MFFLQAVIAAFASSFGSVQTLARLTSSLPPVDEKTFEHLVHSVTSQTLLTVQLQFVSDKERSYVEEELGTEFWILNGSTAIPAPTNDRYGVVIREARATEYSSASG